MKKEITLAALLVGALLISLIVISIIRKKRRDTEDESDTKEPVIQKKEMDSFKLTASDTKQENEELSLLGSPRRERTVMLTYTTLLLKDREHPARIYKADMFGPVYIGRGRENHINLFDESISRRHMRVYRKEGFVYAENLSRVNGTKLNGRYLTEPKKLESGNLLELGRMKFTVEID